MAGVAPTPEQEVTIKSAKSLAEAGAAGADQKVAAYTSAQAEQQKIDDFMKANFDSWDSSTVRKYELEVRKMNGNDIAVPIVEQDLLDFVAKDTTKRLWNAGAFEPKRIAEFDGSPLINLDNVNETYLFGKQDYYLTILQSGPSGQITLTMVQTASDIISSSTSVMLNTSGMGMFSVNINDLLLIKTGSDCCIIKALNSVSGGPHCVGGTPPGATDQATCTTNGGTWVTDPSSLTFEFIVPPAGTIPSGTNAAEVTFTGFNNSERTSHAASQAWAQTIMNYELAQLQAELNSRLSCVTLEKQYWTDNQNTSKNPGVGAILDAEIANINGLLGATPPSTINISDTGISTFNSQKVTRLSGISTRLGQIPGEITTGNCYNQRYNFASGRAHLVNGSLSLTKQLETAKAGASFSKGMATDLANRYGQFV